MFIVVREGRGRGRFRGWKIVKGKVYSGGDSIKYSLNSFELLNLVLLGIIQFANLVWKCEGPRFTSIVHNPLVNLPQISRRPLFRVLILDYVFIVCFDSLTHDNRVEENATLMDIDTAAFE
jgi:hypothetical protein